MASKINIGAAIALDGESEYKQALKNIASEQKLLTSEMKLASSQYSENANSLDALQAKNTILTKQIDAQTDKVKIYSKAVEDSIEKQQKIADKTEAYKDELKKAQAEMDDMKKSSNTTTDALDKQATVISDLEKKLYVSENAYNKAEIATNQYKTSLNIAETSLNKFNDELKQNDQYLEEASKSANKEATSIDNMGKQVAQASKETSNFGNSVKNNVTSAAIIGGVVALGYAMEQVATKTIELGTAAAKYADDMLTMSVQTGISTDKLQAYNYMAELTDTSMETITKTMVKNIKSMTAAQQGTAEYVDAYKRLNVEYEDGNKKLLDSETVYWKLVDALGKIANETERDSLSLTIFGKSAQDLNTLIVQGSSGVAQFTDEAKKMGAILDTDTLKKLGKTDDAIQRFTQSTEILKRKIGAELSDELTRSMNKITDAVTNSGDKITDLAEGGLELLTDGLIWFIDNSDVIIAGLSGIAGAMITSKIVDVVISGVQAYKTLTTATKSAAIAQEGLNLAQSSNAIGLVITAVAGVTAALVAYSLASDNAVTETDRFIEKSKEAAATLQENVLARQENVDSINSEIGFMQTLSVELEKLNAKEVLSNSEKNRMNEIVAKLNATLPSLNLVIDAQTGKVLGNTQAIKDSITANLQWYKVQAAKEELISLMEEQADAELEIYKIDQKIAEQNDIVNKSTEEKIALADKHNKKLQDGTIYYDDFIQKVDLENEKIQDSNDVIEDLTENKNALINSQGDLIDQSDILNGYIAENTDLTNENADAIDGATGTYTVYGDVVKNANEEMSSSIATLNESFNDAKDSAEDSLSTQIGLFEAAEEQSTISVEKMAENLQSQTDAFNQYKDDIIAAGALVEKGLMDEGVLGYIESFGIQGAGALHELVTAAEIDTASFNATMAAWSTMQTAKDNLATSMAEIETGYSEGLVNIGATIDDGSNTIFDRTNKLAELMNDQISLVPTFFSGAGEKMTSDLSDSINSGTFGVVGATTKLATDSMAVLQASVVGKGKAAGDTVINELSASITSGTSKVGVAFQTMINQSVSQASYALQASINRMLGDAMRK